VFSLDSLVGFSHDEGANIVVPRCLKLLEIADAAEPDFWRRESDILGLSSWFWKADRLEGKQSGCVCEWAVYCLACSLGGVIKSE
jgi:hypothetical protein